MIISIADVDISTNEQNAVMDVCRAARAGLVAWSDVREWAKTVSYDVSDMAKAKHAEGTILGSAWDASPIADGIAFDDWSDALCCKLITEEQYAEVFQDRYGVAWSDA